MGCESPVMLLSRGSDSKGGLDCGRRESELGHGGPKALQVVMQGSGRNQSWHQYERGLEG